MSRTPKVLFAIAGLALVPATASAQDNVVANDVTVGNTATGTTTTDPALDPMATDPALNDTTTTYAPPPEQEEDKDFPWGLLGLLGLAGLLGRKKNDDVHVDNRTDRRNV